jgi:hypothetical protein
VDPDVHKNFSNRDERMSECRNVILQHEGIELLEKYKTKFVVVDDNNDNDDNDVLEADLTMLQAELKRDLSKFQDGTDEKILI